MVSKIYCWTEPAVDWGPTDVYVRAIAEDGYVLAGHLSSNVNFAKLDIQHETKLEKYDHHYPDGYELEWVDDVDGHGEILRAFVLNRHLWFAKLLREGKSRDEAYKIVWGWKDARAK